jgi:hypothetical protein
MDNRSQQRGVFLHATPPGIAIAKGEAIAEGEIPLGFDNLSRKADPFQPCLSPRSTGMKILPSSR